MSTGSNRITDAEYTVNHKNGTTTVTQNQQQNGGNWVLLGPYQFDTTGSVKLTDKTVAHSGQSGYVVSADAIKVEKDLTGITDNENTDFAYQYDANGNLTQLTDNSPHARVKTYAITYDGLNQVSQVQEKDASGNVKRSITFTYDANGNPTNDSYEQEIADFEYDVRNLLTKVRSPASTPTQSQLTNYKYNDNWITDR